MTGWALHAGGVVIDGGVWALLGEKGAGKTTTLVACRERGLPVLADDLVIVQGHTAFAGPRSLDLRPETAERLGPGHELIRVRDGERARLMLPSIAAELPFRGCVVLEEAKSVEMANVPLAGRLALLSRHVMVSDRAQQGLLDLLALPMWSLRRPRRWDCLPQAVDALVRSSAADPRVPDGPRSRGADLLQEAAVEQIGQEGVDVAARLLTVDVEAFQDQQEKLRACRAFGEGAPEERSSPVDAQVM